MLSHSSTSSESVRDSILNIIGTVPSRSRGEVSEGVGNTCVRDSVLGISCSRGRNNECRWIAGICERQSELGRGLRFFICTLGFTFNRNCVRSGCVCTSKVGCLAGGKRRGAGDGVISFATSSGREATREVGTGDVGGSAVCSRDGLTAVDDRASRRVYGESADCKGERSSSVCISRGASLGRRPKCERHLARVVELDVRGDSLAVSERPGAVTCEVRISSQFSGESIWLNRIIQGLVA